MFRTRQKTMTLFRSRRARAPVILAVSAIHVFTSLRPTPALAQDTPSETGAAQEATSGGATYDQSSRAALSKRVTPPTSDAGAGAAAPASTDPPAAVQSALNTAPSGGGVSPQAAALPTGPATQLGMGESFSMQLSTGAVGYSVPIAMPTARGRAQPTLGLSYSSGAGSGLAGVGWSIGTPAVARQTDRGLPGYDDRATWHPNQDRFSFAGMELVPICTVTNGLCPAAQPGEVMPSWSEGWQYFRSRNEISFIRMFWSPDHRTWRGQSKDGTTLELGVPTDGTKYEGALERNPDAPSQIFRWYLVRQYDTQTGAGGQPVNSVTYRYASDGNSAYLTDIVDTSPASAPTSTDLALYAHHTVITYAVRPDVAVSYRAGYRQNVAWRASDIDVTSKPFSGGSSVPREMVRRYHLGYDPSVHRSLLVSLVTEGRCSSPVTEDATQRLPRTSCPRLPPLTFEYQRTAGAGAAPVDSTGLRFGGFDTTIRSLSQSPPHSLDDPDTGLMDINGDGLPDVVATAPAFYSGRHGLFLNAAGNTGTIGFGQQTTMSLTPTGDVPDAGVLMLHSPTVSALDFDSDGFVDLVHFPSANRYSVFSAKSNGLGGFQWAGREIHTASQQSVKVNFAQDAPHVRVADVNGDGLVDIVYSSPTELQTFFSLGRFPVGDGQFGTATWTSASTAAVKNDPVVFCPPWSGKPLRLSDPDVQLADMNGDGLVDIVRVRDGELLYWPGRGNGFWGTGAAAGCSGGNLFATDRHIAMKAAPRFGSYDPGSLLLNDVDGDGLADMVVVRSQGVEIFLNDNGLGWTSITRIDNTPFRPAGRTHVRLTDIDGSGTPDILWGLAGEYRYIDLNGGAVPNLLAKVSNGIGETVTFEYTSSTNQMLAVAAAGKPWSTVAPTIMPVLSRTVARDHAELIGRPAGSLVREYTYRDPVYEGRQREFRGFGDVVVKTVGDANSPTTYEHTVFQLGECSLQFVGTTADVCTSEQRWQDNWREPLKGLPVLNETYDSNGVYLTSGHTTFELRKLYSGIDGRGVYAVIPIRSDQLVYDTGPFNGQPSTVVMDEVVVTIPGLAHTETRPVVSRATAGTARLQSAMVVDNFGNTTEVVQRGCISGCPNGVDEVITAHSEFDQAAGNTSGWLWREMRSYVTGSVNTALRNESLHSYDVFGNLFASYRVLSGTLALDRHHVIASRAMAPSPPTQSGGTSTPAQILVTGPVYDSFGNAVFNRGPSGRCNNREYDPDYQQLPVTERVAGGPLNPSTACGANLFSHQVTYDRGLSLVVDSLDARLQPSRYGYDGFGRLTSITHVSPFSPGDLAPLPSMTFSYQLPTNPDVTPYTITVVRTQDGANAFIPSYTERQIIRDSMGRTIVRLQEADSTAGDMGDWVASGYVSYDAKGNVARDYNPAFYSGTIPGALAGPPAATPYTSQQYDAFDRPTSTFGFDHAVTSLMVYHAASTDAYDAADVLATAHQGTYATKMVDGHGRTVQAINRIKVGSTLEQRSVLARYLPTGEVVSLTQRRAGSSDVVRTIQHDSLGRMVLNNEPNTSSGGTRPLRYAYDDAGKLVGTSDARGCGANFFYDLAGRLVAVDRSPCLGQHALYSPPDLATGDGTEAFYRYDGADPESDAVVDAAGTALSVDVGQLWGRMTSVSSLASKAIYRYDALGRGTGVGVRVQKPGTAAAQLASRYAPRWYVKESVLDAADRLVSSSSGATVPELLGGDGTSALRATYTKRGQIRQFTSSYGTLYAGGVILADGRPQSVTLGDAASTHRDLTYDVNLRLRTAQTFRSAAPLWSSPPSGSNYTPPLPTDDPTLQLMLENKVLSYDEVGNLTQDEDNRVAADWPITAKPVTRTFTYDDLYRLTRTTYAYPGGAADSWKSPFAAENQDAAAKPQPSPHVGFAQRMTDQQFQYDWLGNLIQSTDDQQAFWDRSTGTRSVGFSGSGPNQTYTASNRTLAPTSSAMGDLNVGYDSAGNIYAIIVRRDGACLPTGSSCSQRFVYDWDEVGQLVSAKRWDLSAAELSANGQHWQPSPTRAANADLRYAYDSNGARVLKTAVDSAGNQSHTLYVFSTLEVRRTTFSSTTGNYVVDANTTSVRLPAGPTSARVVYMPSNLPSVSGRQHVLLDVGDQIGSSSFVIDRETGELVEASRYQSYGAIESDYRPSRWGSQREPYKFGGKEEDIEVGLTYFGARYYSPYLGLWISPDPVTIHGLGSDLNPYAYVYGSPQMHVDPDGRILPIVAFFIVVGIAALVAGTTTAIQQANAGAGWSSIQWGTVFMSAGIGAAAGAVSFGVGAVVAPWVGAAAGGVVGTAAGTSVGTVVGAAAGGAAGSAFGYAATCTLIGGEFSWGGLGRATAIGGIAGVTGAAAGLSASAQGVGAGWSMAASGIGSGVGGFFGTVYVGGQAATWQGFALSVGAGLAGSIATHKALTWGKGSGTGSGSGPPSSTPGGTTKGPLEDGPAPAAKAPTGQPDLPDTIPLEARAFEIRDLVHPIAQNRRTVSVGEGVEGEVLVGGSGRDLERIQVNDAEAHGEIPVKLPGEDAERTVIYGAAKRNIRLGAIAATRDFCAECFILIKNSGGEIVTPNRAIFPNWTPPKD